jgi:hypothetical protein
MQRRLFKDFILFAVGGGVYYLLEAFWRGHSHPPCCLAGLCFLLVGRINEQVLTWHMPLSAADGDRGRGGDGRRADRRADTQSRLGLAIWDYSAPCRGTCGGRYAPNSRRFVLAVGGGNPFGRLPEILVLGEEKPRYTVTYRYSSLPKNEGMRKLRRNSPYPFTSSFYFSIRGRTVS